MKRVNFLLLTAWIAVMTASAALAQMKYVAVIETEVDAASGVSADLSAAEVRQITAELRREAVKNLPNGKYNIMTTETVYAQGSAVLEECAEENCVIALGSRIGADYIVRGTVSKFKTWLTLSIEIYETENGNLVASSEPIRSENAAELLMLAAATSADMYKAFVDSRDAVRKPPIKLEPEPEPEPPKPTAPKPNAGLVQEPQAKKRHTTAAVGLDALGAGLFVYGIIEDGNIKKYADNGKYKSRDEYNSAKKSGTNRNIGYILGGAFLLSGISVHIFF